MLFSWRQVPAWSRERLNKVLNDAVQRTDLSDDMLESLALQLDDEAACTTASAQHSVSTFSPGLQSALAHSKLAAPRPSPLAPR